MVYVPSTLWMNYAQRFPLQLFLPVIAFAGAYTDRLSAKQVGNLAAGLVVLLLSNYDMPELTTLLAYTSNTYYSQSVLGARLAALSGRNHTLLTGQAGALPYYAGWQAYDLVGLADKTIAHYGNSPAYLSSITPDLILLYGTDAKETAVEMRIFDQQIVYEWLTASARYEYLGAIRIRDHYYLLAFVKRKVADHDAIADIVADTSHLAETMNSRGIVDMARPHWRYVE